MLAAKKTHLSPGPRLCHLESGGRRDVVRTASTLLWISWRMNIFTVYWNQSLGLNKCVGWTFDLVLFFLSRKFDLHVLNLDEVNSEPGFNLIKN